MLWKLPSFRLTYNLFFFLILLDIFDCLSLSNSTDQCLSRVFSSLSLGNQQNYYQGCKNTTQFPLHLLPHDRGKPWLFLSFGNTVSTHQPMKWLQSATKREAKTFKYVSCFNRPWHSLGMCQGGRQRELPGKHVMFTFLTQKYFSLACHHFSWIIAWRKENGLYCFCKNKPVCLPASLGQGCRTLQTWGWVSTCSISFEAKYRVGKM